MKRITISSGSPWEDIVGYSRAVRVGNLVEVAGTTAVENGAVVGVGDVYAQAVCIFKKIEAALKLANAGMEHVVRTKAYITDISLWEAYGKAHAEFFINIRPVTTLVEVSALIDPEMLLEVEVSAILPE